MTWLIRYLEWPMELVIAAWSLGSIYPQYCCVVYQPMKTFSKPVWGYQLQQLLCCETYSIHFKQNAKTSMPEQIKWRGDQNAVFLPYQMATGISVSVCWRLTPMELKLISVHLLKIWDWWHWNPHFCQSCTKKKKSHPRCNVSLMSVCNIQKTKNITLTPNQPWLIACFLSADLSVGDPLAPWSSQCYCRCSVIWGIFGLTSCVPFAWEVGSKESIMACIWSWIALVDDCHVSLDIYCVFMCFVYSCVQSCRK